MLFTVTSIEYQGYSSCGLFENRANMATSDSTQNVAADERSLHESVKVTIPLSWANRSDHEPARIRQQSNNTNAFSVNPLTARFFVIKLKEGSFQNVSPFLIHKSIQSVVGDVKNIKKLRSGDIMIEVNNAQQATASINCTALANLSVTVTAHNTLNFSRGVISEPDLLYTSEEEILENLRDQHVCGVRRITIRRDQQTIPTRNIILTFETPSLPTHITAGYLRCPLRPYIPNPLRCFQCQRYGHSKVSCRGAVTCARCADVGHESDTCNACYRCVNCGGEHAAFSRSCPSWQAEKEVQVLKYEKQLSYPEARRIVKSRTPKVGLSYSAAVASKSVRSMGTQTEFASTASQTTVIPSIPSVSHTSSQKLSTSVSEISQFVESQKKKPKITKPTVISNVKTSHKLSARKSSKNKLPNNQTLGNSVCQDELDLCASDLSEDDNMNIDDHTEENHNPRFSANFKGGGKSSPTHLRRS